MLSHGKIELKPYEEVRITAKSKDGTTMSFTAYCLEGQDGPVLYVTADTGETMVQNALTTDVYA